MNEKTKPNTPAAKPAAPRAFAPCPPFLPRRALPVYLQPRRGPGAAGSRRLFRGRRARVYPHLARQPLLWPVAAHRLAQGQTRQPAKDLAEELAREWAAEEVL